MTLDLTQEEAVAYLIHRATLTKEEAEEDGGGKPVMGVTLAGSSEGTPFYRNCNDIALQLQ